MVVVGTVKLQIANGNSVGFLRQKKNRGMATSDEQLWNSLIFSHSSSNWDQSA